MSDYQLHLPATTTTTTNELQQLSEQLEAAIAAAVAGTARVQKRRADADKFSQEIAVTGGQGNLDVMLNWAKADAKAEVSVGSPGTKGIVTLPESPILPASGNIAGWAPKSARRHRSQRRVLFSTRSSIAPIPRPTERGNAARYRLGAPRAGQVGHVLEKIRLGPEQNGA